MLRYLQALPIAAECSLVSEAEDAMSDPLVVRSAWILNLRASRLKGIVWERGYK